MRTAIVAAAGLVAVASAGSADWTDTSVVDVTVTSCAPTHTNCPYSPVDAASASTTVAWEDWSSSVPVDPAKKTTTTTTTTASWEDWSTTTTTKKVDPAKATTTTTPSWEDWSKTTTTTKKVDAAKASSTSVAWEDWSTTKSSSVAAAATTSSCPAYTATAPPAWFSYLPSDALSSIEAKWTGAPPADWCYYTYSTAAWGTSTVAPAKTSSTAYWPVGTSTTAVAAASSGWAYSGSATTPVLPKWTGAANTNAGSLVVAGLAAVAALVIV